MKANCTTARISGDSHLLRLSSIILLIAIVFCVLSCGKNSKNSQVAFRVDSLQVSTKIIAPADSVILELSYNLSCPYPYGGGFSIMGYNDKVHALDIFTDSATIERIQLDHHGENAITGRVAAITAINTDSIWLYDRIAFYLIDSKGRVLHKHKDDRLIFLDANYAMQTASMGWYGGDVLLYPVDVKGKFYIEHYSLKEKRVIKETPLDFPDCNKDGKNLYADMKYPNVSFSGSKVIYNYPYDSGIMTIDLTSGERRKYKASSRFADSSLKPYKGAENMQDWLNYDWGNAHFFEVVYLPKQGLYARLMLGGIDANKHKDRNSIIDARKLYVSFMDADFNVVGEFLLKEKRYSNFHGWCAMPNAIAVYVDNLLDNEVCEDLVFDEIIPIIAK